MDTKEEDYPKYSQVEMDDFTSSNQVVVNIYPKYVPPVIIEPVDFLYNMTIAVCEYCYVAAMYFYIIILRCMIFIVGFCINLYGILKDFNCEKFTNPII